MTGNLDKECVSRVKDFNKDIFNIIEHWQIFYPTLGIYCQLIHSYPPGRNLHLHNQQILMQIDPDLWSTPHKGIVDYPVSEDQKVTWVKYGNMGGKKIQ